MKRSSYSLAFTLPFPETAEGRYELIQSSNAPAALGPGQSVHLSILTVFTPREKKEDWVPDTDLPPPVVTCRFLTLNLLSFSKNLHENLFSHTVTMIVIPAWYAIT